MSGDRRAVRILAMQSLCQWDVQHDETLDASVAVAELVEAPSDVQRAARELVEAYWMDHAAFDARVVAAAQHWDLQRISLVDRNVLRVAVTEMLSGQVPPKVALDEAIEIAKEFGGADSPRFVNGVLDAVLKKVQSETATPPTRDGATSV